MNNVKVSVIIPVYNVEKYLAESLNSILNQTFCDFEVICINDGSTDNSLDILQEYKKKDNRFRIYSQENQGQGKARNFAINNSKGKYIIFVDPDDFIDAEALEIINKKFNETDADVIQLDFKTFLDGSHEEKTWLFSKRMKKHFNYALSDGNIYRWSKINGNNFIDMSMSTCDKAYKASFIKNNDIKFAPTRFGEDHLFSIGATILAEKILYLQQAFYHYRTRPDSTVNKVSDGNFCVFDNIELVKNFLVSKNLYHQYESIFEDYKLTILGWHYSGISESSAKAYLQRCSEILTEDEYRLFMKKTEGNFSWYEKIFSIKNVKEHGKKIKYLTIFGIKVRLCLFNN